MNKNGKTERHHCAPAESPAIPPEVLDLLRFMCAIWHQVDGWAYRTSDELALSTYPVIQGTANQLNLQRIGEQPHDTANLNKAVQWMLENPGDRAE